MGGLIGGAAVQTFFDIETRPHKVVREFGTSLSNLALYRKEFREGPTHHTFRVTSRQVTVPLQPLPSLSVAEANLADANRRLEKLRNEKAPTTKTYPAMVVTRWAEGVVEKRKAGVTKRIFLLKLSAFESTIVPYWQCLVSPLSRLD